MLKLENKLELHNNALANYVIGARCFIRGANWCVLGWCGYCFRASRIRYLLRGLLWTLFIGLLRILLVGRCGFCFRAATIVPGLLRTCFELLQTLL